MMARLLAALAIALAVGGAPVSAQTYPSKPITMIVPFAAGGPLDAIARVMAPPLGEALGKPVIVENVAGAGGMLGSSRVAKASPDGYQLVFGTAGTHAYNQTLYKKPLYNAATDFAPIGIVAESFFVLMVRKDFPATTLGEFVAYAKASAAQMHFGSAGAGSATHIVCLRLTSAMGVTIGHVPYRSTMQAIEDVIAGRIDFVCDAGSTALPLIQGNLVKPIAQLGPQRAPMLPDLATAGEQGLAGIAVSGWNAFFFPKDTPAPIVRTLNKAAGAMLERPAVREQLHRIGLVIPASERRSPDFLARFLASEIETWAAPIKASGVSMD